LVDATGGVKVDACRVTDYTKVLEDVATSGLSVENPVFSLKGKIKRILKVTIDGVETSAFLWDKAKNTLTLFGNISLADEKNVSIEFESE
jgi:hypothetical protein